MTLSRPAFPLLLLAALTACADKGEDTAGSHSGHAEADADADADSDADTDADTDEGCAALQEGRWDTTGACFGMPMDATLAMDAGTCSFTFSDWNMQMSVPEGGTIAGDTLTFTGEGWTDCTGTINADGSSVTGVCSDSGCAFGMTVQ